MSEVEFEGRRLSFGAASSSYADHRPGYPDEALRWVLDLVDGPVERIADVGAGAGALTRSLVRMAAQVGVDALMVGQAWHWFDRAAAAAEFTRVVRPGGVIGLLWNVRDDREPWMAALSDLIDGEDSLRAIRADALPLVAAVHPQVERREFGHQVPMPPEAVVGLVSTFSYVRLRPDADAVLAAVRELLATHPDTAGRTTVDLPYVTAAYRIPCP